VLDGAEEEPEDWIPPTGEELEEAWQIWVLLESTDWKHLPVFPGGLFDQSARLMSHLGTISKISRLIRRDVRRDMGKKPF
jgi:hypothetical protein